MAEVMALFDVVIESSKVGVRKPDPRFYEMACELLDVEARGCVFLDDLGINLKPARAMGMTTIKVLEPAASPRGSRGGRRLPAGLTSDLQAGERLVEQVVELLAVDDTRAGRRAARLDAAHLVHLVARVLDLVAAVVHEPPRPHVLGLLLQPDDLASVLVAAQDVDAAVAREREQLLDAHDRDRSAPSSSRRAMASHATLPEQKMMRRTAAGSVIDAVVEHLLERPGREVVDRRSSAASRAAATSG